MARSRGALIRCLGLVAVTVQTCALPLVPQRAPPRTPTTLAITPDALRYLQVSYGSYGENEFGGCLMGRVNGDTLEVEHIAPADVAALSDEHVTQVLTCTQARWPGVVGFVHSHPGGVNCSHYYFVTRSLMGESSATKTLTHVRTSDWYRFIDYTTEAISMIYCGEHVVWMGRDGVETDVRLPKDSPAEPRRVPTITKDSTK